MEEITITVYLSSLFSYSVVAMAVAVTGAWVVTTTAVQVLSGLSYFLAAVEMAIASLAATTIAVAAAS